MKKYLTISILFFVFISFMGLQTFWKFIPESKLGGVERMVKVLPLNPKSWFSMKFQRSFDDSVNQKVAFKGIIVKSNNQMDYDLFKESNAGGTRIVIGKDDWLFQQTAIDFGIYESCSDTNVLKREIDTLREFYNKVKPYNKNIVFLGSPNKVDIYPEFVQNKYLKHKETGKDMYKFLLESIQTSTDIPCIDGRKFLLDLKDKGVENLFPQGGAHWSVYTSSLILEELLQMTGYTDTPIIEYTNTPAHFMDTDLVDLMNIWTPQVFAGPNINYPIDSSSNFKREKKPSILFVGDSACHLLAYAAIYSEVFSDVQVVYYNSSIITHYKDRPKSKIKINKQDSNISELYKKLLNYDIVVLSMSEQHMTFPERMLSYGFPNFVVELFKQNPDFMEE
jgi:hypothetical protein